MGGSEARGAVVLIHGILISPKWMWPLARDLKRAGFGPVWNLGFGRGPDLTTISRRLGEELQRAASAHDGPIHALGLSMGGLLLRRMHANGALPAHPQAHYVTLGTPHAGAARAAWGVRRFPRLTRVVYGPTLRELVPGSPFLEALPQLPVQQLTSVYAGTGTDEGRSSLLPGDDDGVVETQSAHVDGAHNVLIQGVHHYVLSFRRASRAAAVQALEAGVARAADAAQG